MKKTLIGHILMIIIFIIMAALISTFHMSAWWMSAAAFVAVVLPSILTFNLNTYAVLGSLFILSVIAPLSILMLISPDGELNVFDYLGVKNTIQLVLPTVIASMFVAFAKQIKGLKALLRK